MSAAHILSRTTPEIDTARATLAERTESAARLSSDAQARRSRLEEIKTELPAALAHGDAAAVAALRAERTEHEAELRDVTAAEQIAQQRAEAADTALAALETDILNEQLTEDSAVFRDAIARAWEAAERIRRTRAVAKQRHNRAFGPTSPKSPDAFVRLGSAAQFFAQLADFNSAPGADAN